jgi:hypothetical protein
VSGYASATVATVAESSRAPTVTTATISIGASPHCIATISGNTAVPTRIAAASTVVAVAAVADESPAMTTRADSDGAVVGVVGEPVAAQQPRIGVLRISIFEEQIKASG